MATLSVTTLTAAAPPSTVPSTMPATTTAAVTYDERVFVVTPARPAAALTHRFDFPRDEQFDGNGAPMLLQALMMLPTDESIYDKLEPDDAPDSDDDFLARVRQHTPGLDTRVPTALADAVRYHTCAFDWPVRDRGVNTLLPYLNNTRGLANHVHLRTRLAVATGDWRAAIDLIRANFLLADHIDDGDTFGVVNLVSAGIAHIALADVHRVIQRPDCPNLYWAVCGLPRPFGNARVALHNEEAIWEMTFRELGDARRGRELSADEWRRVAEGVMKFSQGPDATSTSQPASRPTDPRTDPLTLAVARAAYAKRYGRPAAEVGRLDATRVVAAYFYFSYRELANEAAQCAGLPTATALPRLRALEPHQARVGRAQPDNPLLRMSRDLPAASTRHLLEANARLDRAIAATAAVEAVRAYAADHDGRLPATLADVIDTPPPANPATGRPFEYAVSDGVAVVGDTTGVLRWPLRYEVRLRE